MKKKSLPLIALALFIGTTSCKKDQFTASDSSGLTYQASNNFLINPSPIATDSLRSIVNIEKIDFLCDIEENRLNYSTNQKDGYEFVKSDVKTIAAINFVLEERNANPAHPSLGNYLKESVLEIYHGDAQDITLIGTCETVTEIGLSYDRLTFDIDYQNLIAYVNTFPDYKFRVVNKFTNKPIEDRSFSYKLDMSYNADHIYIEE